MNYEALQACIEACNDCAIACDNCASACLDEQDVGPMVRCIALDIDCASICRVASGYMSRDSELAALVCDVCAEVCDACAEECEEHDMDHCRACAEACRRCAEECRRVALLPAARETASVGAAAH
jgi:hypothetical protein